MAGAFEGTPLGLTSTILNLAAVLTRKQLKVPRYQRPYTWTDREVRELIQDLWRAYKRSATFYFIGQIVLVKNHGKLEVSEWSATFGDADDAARLCARSYSGAREAISNADYGWRHAAPVAA